MLSTIKRRMVTRVASLVLIGSVTLLLGSCQLLSLFQQPVDVQGRIDAFNADLKSYNWSGLVKQFASDTSIIQNGTLTTGNAEQFFSSYPFSKADNPSNPGQIQLDSKSVVYNSTKTSATMTATYKGELTSTFDLAITMELSSSDNSWYIRVLEFTGSAFQPLKHMAPLQGEKLPKAIR